MTVEKRATAENTAAGRAVRLGVPLFEQGFRPFFLLAGSGAVGVILPWVAALRGAAPPDGPLPLPLWHAHEMPAGFVGAAMAGFLLTAIPNRLGGPGYGGAPLAFAAGAFLAARVALAPGSPVPVGVAAALGLLPIPLPLLRVAPALVRSRRARVFGPPALVLAFWAADVLMLGDAAGWWETNTWDTGKLLALDLAVLLIGPIGGRIVPSFTLNAPRKRVHRAAVPPRNRLFGPSSRPLRDGSPRDGDVGEADEAPEPSPAFPRADETANLSLAAVVLVDVAAPGGQAAGAVAALAAVLCALRLSRWHGWRVAGEPILSVLHAAWTFVPLGLAVKAALPIGGAAWASVAWLHLLGAGALGLMVLAVMTRATLGHTGRDLRADAATVAAYALVAAAALIRAFGPAVMPHGAAYGLAGASWVGGFGPFLWRFAPMPIAPRVDRR